MQPLKISDIASSVTAAGGSFVVLLLRLCITPILKYTALSGRVFAVCRINPGDAVVENTVPVHESQKEILVCFTHLVPQGCDRHLVTLKILIKACELRQHPVQKVKVQSS